jgi:hypothetical protein
MRTPNPGVAGVYIVMGPKLTKTLEGVCSVGAGGMMLVYGLQRLRGTAALQVAYYLACQAARCVSAISFMLANRKSYFGVLSGGCVAPKPV